MLLHEQKAQVNSKFPLWSCSCIPKDLAESRTSPGNPTAMIKDTRETCMWAEIKWANTLGLPGMLFNFSIIFRMVLIFLSAITFWLINKMNLTWTEDKQQPPGFVQRMSPHSHCCLSALPIGEAVEQVRGNDRPPPDGNNFTSLPPEMKGSRFVVQPRATNVALLPFSSPPY